MGGTSQKDVTTTNAPWNPAAQAVTPALNAAKGLTFDAQGNLISQPTGMQRGVAQGMYDYSQNDPMQAGAMDYYGNVLAGGTNPYLKGMFDQAAGGVRSQLDSQFAKAGRYGSSDHAREMGQAYNDLATDMYGQQYNADQSRMMQAAQLAPQAGYQGFQNQMGAADQLEGFDYDQQMQQLQNYLGMVSPMLGAGGTSTTPMFRNKTLETVGAVSGLLGGIGSFMGGIG